MWPKRKKSTAGLSAMEAFQAQQQTLLEQAAQMEELKSRVKQAEAELAETKSALEEVKIDKRILELERKKLFEVAEMMGLNLDKILHPGSAADSIWTYRGVRVIAALLRPVMERGVPEYTSASKLDGMKTILINLPGDPDKPDTAAEQYGYIAAVAQNMILLPRKKTEAVA